MSSAEMLTSPEFSEKHTLDSLFEIEDVLEYIAILQKKVEHFNNLKKYRTQVLSEKIEKISGQITKLKSIILSTMEEKAPDDKTMDFTPIGKVTRKKAIRKWNIEDEEEITTFLRSKNLDEGVIEKKEKIVKKELNKVLDALKKKKIPGVSFDPGNETLSVIYEKKYVPKDEKKQKTEHSNDQVEIEEMEEISVGSMEI